MPDFTEEDLPHERHQPLAVPQGTLHPPTSDTLATSSGAPQARPCDWLSRYSAGVGTTCVKTFDRLSNLHACAPPFAYRLRTHALFFLLQIKSLDKKLRKLDAAMTHAKDDPSMLHAVHGAVEGYARWSGQGELFDWSGAEAPTRCPDYLSNAVTPREHSSHASPSCSGSEGTLTPEAPFPSDRWRPAQQANAHVPASVPVNVPAQSHGHGAPIEVEFSLPPAMIKHLEKGNMRFVVKGLTGTGELSAADFRFAESGMSAQHDEWEEASVLQMEAEDDNTGPSAPASQDMSDEDLIALLANCAAQPVAHEHDIFAQVLSERISAVADELQQSDSETSHEGESDLAMEPGDDVLMAALANCCGGQSPFESGNRCDTNAVHTRTLEPSSFSHESYNVEEEMMALHSFSGGHGMALEDFLGA